MSVPWFIYPWCIYPKSGGWPVSYGFLNPKPETRNPKPAMACSLRSCLKWRMASVLWFSASSGCQKFWKVSGLVHLL